MAVINKRIFDTDNALKGSFNGWWGKWQIITYSCFIISYAIIIGWVYRLPDYTLLEPVNVECDYSNMLNELNYTNSTLIQQLSGKPKYIIENYTFKYNFSGEYGQTVLTEFNILCGLSSFKKLPRFSNFLGYIVGALLLGFGSDRGGRKIIILACIWTTGIMSVFQLVGHDFISFIFFQFFIGLFIGGIQASFLPAIIEMFPINFRAFYGVFFHLVISLFEIILPWLAKSFKSWNLLQIFVTTPIVLTAVLQWFVYESIFWYLAHKEYDKAIKNLTKLAKRNGILFESKFKQAKDFLHAKHSKATQVDILPLLRLQDLEILGKKYPQVDMAELQKNKGNSSKLRVFLNSLKGESYRSTNTIYRPFDFIYSPTLLVYVLILSGLWLTNGLTDSMDAIKPTGKLDFYVESTLVNLGPLFASIIAIILSIFKIGRRWMIFLAYLIVEVCFLGSLIAEYSKNNVKDDQTEIALFILYHLCKASTHFGFIFLMLITAELFPTSLRCTGMGICFTLRMFGSFLASPNMLGYNSNMHRLAYCLLTLFFGSMTLFLPETKTFPLPRSILQIEAMPTAIGKSLRSRKVKLACERRQNELIADNQTTQVSQTKYSKSDRPKVLVTGAIELNNTNQNDANTSSYIDDNQNQTNGKGSQTAASSSTSNPKVYDTVTSVHDIEQDDHIYYAEKKDTSLNPLLGFERKLTNIAEVPSKNITRNNSISDALDHANTKV